MIVTGLISGTSADGIDAAVVEITGMPPQLRVSLLAFHTAPWPKPLRERILAAAQGRVTTGELCRLNFELGEHFARAALQAIALAGLTPEQVDLIGSHGQTVWHDVDENGHVTSTLQLGEASVIAERTGVTTISNFRARDVAVGGQGAPLVAYVDWLLLRHPAHARAVQNIGGIANVTYLPPGEDPGGVIAFDTGPGNMLIDAAAARASGGALAFDHDGELARRGRVDEMLLAEWLTHPYFQQQPPKTTGRELFGSAFFEQAWAAAQARGLTPDDTIATFTALTVRSIADAYHRFLPSPVAEVIVGGGGAHNPTLMKQLREALAPARVLTHEDVGIRSDAKEAIAFAVLAYESWHGRPGNLPSATGARRAVVLGQIIRGTARGACN
ncbi:MAG: anhydro-N-acetylmuramic acid kinase [Anaerolineae bacterium]|nr:anhydro-N-acetylmuramic acid kinase [Anaerolineae bacterium]MDW8100374.1 anhydro-N-acetylmuramic acid kinase [Anaerolineae bacterium]